MQFDRDATGQMTPLPKPSVDTGAGLERITAVLQGKNTNYDTDLFARILAAIEEIRGKRTRDGSRSRTRPCVVADHARAAAILIGDGVLPSNEGRGYVLRTDPAPRAALRAPLGIERPFLTRLARRDLDVRRTRLPDPTSDADNRTASIASRRRRFRRTMSIGAARVEEEISAARPGGDDSVGRGRLPPVRHSAFPSS